MTCTVCYKYMCWICEKAIAGYDHFRDNPRCNTFSMNEWYDNADLGLRQPALYYQAPVRRPVAPQITEVGLKNMKVIIFNLLLWQICLYNSIDLDLKTYASEQSDQGLYCLSLIEQFKTNITKTCLFKCIENFTTKKGKFSDKKFYFFFFFSYICTKHRLWVLIKTTLTRPF